MSEEFLKWALGGIAAALAIGYARLWTQMWKKDEEVDKVRGELEASRELAVAAREKIIDGQRIRIEELTKQNYDIQIGFEKTHGATIRKALSLVMAAKHNREPREPKTAKDAVSQLNRLTQELDGAEVEEILRSVRGD